MDNDQEAAFLTHYYVNPQPEHVVEHVRWCIKHAHIKGIADRAALDGVNDGDAKLIPALGLLGRVEREPRFVVQAPARTNGARPASPRAGADSLQRHLA